MKNDSIKQEIKKLTDSINYHNNLYYNGTPEISDYEFDRLLEKLKILEDKFPQYKSTNSPTKKVGEHTTKGFKSIKHLYPMLSLANSYSREDLTKFIERVHKNLGESDVGFFCELKFDGVAISMIYEKESSSPHYLLQKVLTRGDGVQGDDIIENAKTIQKMPSQILALITDGLITQAPSTKKNEKIAFDTPSFSQKYIVIHAEAFMPKTVFKKLNDARKKNDQKLFANPRNTTAGTLKLLDSNIIKKRSLSYYAYSLKIGEKDVNSITQEKSIHLLENWGFNISKTYKKCKNISEIFEYIDCWEKLRHDIDVDIDGVVIKVNNIQQQQNLGATAKSPRWAIAYKYKPENISTVLEKITYQVGRIGTITPVANLNPVLISGTIVKRASLHNIQEIARLDVREGDTVFVEKGGEIIPKITSVDFTKRQKGNLKPIFPKVCPSCNSVLVCPEGEVNIYCLNTKECTDQVKECILHFASRKAMDIRELGPSTIEKLIGNKFIKSSADLYKLKFEDIYKLEGFKEQSVKNLIEGINISKSKPFKKVLFALGIRHVGINVSSIIAREFGSLNNIIQAKLDDFINIKDIGTQVANSVLLFFKDSYNLSEIKKLQEAKLIFQENFINKNKEKSVLNNKILVISGTFKTFSRERLKDLILDYGGRVTSSISKNTNFLIAGSNAGPQKLEKAKQLNVSIVNEVDFSKMINKVV